MLNALRAWLNGKRQYWTGVALYAQLGKSARLQELFKKGPTDFTVRRLHEELLIICRDLKKPPAVTGTMLPSSVKTAPAPFDHQPSRGADQEAAENPDPLNPELYIAAKTEADKAYKAMMNKRAILFNMAPLDDLTEPNTEARIREREKLCLEIVQDYEFISQLYDQADHIKKTGRLPNAPDPEEEKIDTDAIADHLVKQTLDNARKNYNKMKAREQTAERVAMLQNHKLTIEKLEARWTRLKAK